MINPVLEKIALVEHIMSFFCTIITIYFNDNFNIQYLAFMSMIQHFIKILRIMIYGFDLQGSPIWFCNLHAFVNHFSNNILVIITCIIIFNLFIALKYPNYFAKYNKKMRPHIVVFSIVYTAVFTLGAFFEPIFIGYTEEEIASRHNCSTAYRHKFYQYILGSTLTDIEFTIVTIYCTIYIMFKIIIIPKIKRRASLNTKTSLFKWTVVLFLCTTITLISLLNIKNDIRDAFDAEEGKLEEDYLDVTYLITASSGVLIMAFFVSPKQIKYKLGMDVGERSNPWFEYKFSYDSETNINDDFSKPNKFLNININSNKGSKKFCFDFINSNILKSKETNYDHSNNYHSSFLQKQNGNRYTVDMNTFIISKDSLSKDIDIKDYYYNKNKNTKGNNNNNNNNNNSNGKCHSSYCNKINLHKKHASINNNKYRMINDNFDYSFDNDIPSFNYVLKDINSKCQDQLLNYKK